MKKFLLLLLALFVFVIPSVAYADTDENAYTVYVDGEKQEFTGVVKEGELYFPIKALYTAVGAELSEDAENNKEFYKVADVTVALDKTTMTFEADNDYYFFSPMAIRVNGELYASEDVFGANLTHELLPNNDAMEVYFLNYNNLLEKAATMNSDLKTKIPELYEAIEKTYDTSYGFNMNMNAIVKMHYDNEETAAMMQLRRAVATAYMSGYLDLPKQAMDMNMDMGIDAGMVMKESINGMKFKLVDDMIYVFDPTTESWTSEKLGEEEAFALSAQMMKGGNKVYLWFADDQIKKRVNPNGSVVYSIVLNGEDVKNMVDEILGQGPYDMMIAEMEKTGVNFDIDELELEYMLTDGELSVQHIELTMNVGTPEASAEVIISLDAEYYSYGLEKQVEVPSEMQ